MFPDIINVAMKTESWKYNLTTGVEEIGYHYYLISR
jgi:hypothetical protein